MFSLDVEEWNKLQNPVPSDFASTEEMDRKTQRRQKRGVPVKLDLTEDGYPVIPDEPLKLTMQHKREVYQSFVKLSWREYLIITSDIELK
jgi:hypothetical protein